MARKFLTAVALSLLFVGSYGQDGVVDRLAVAVPFAPSIFSNPFAEWATSFTPDNKTVFFSRGNNAGSGIFFSNYDHGVWGKPQLASFSSKWKDFDGFVSPDGTRIIFCSNRPLEGAPQDQANPKTHLWYVEHIEGDRWGIPHHIEGGVNIDGSSDYGPSVSAGGTLYWCSREREGHKGMQSFYSAWLGDHYDYPKMVSIPGVESVQDPFIAPDEQYIVFLSGHDLFISFRQGDAWSMAENLGPRVNTGQDNSSPYVSRDGKMLYYTTPQHILMIPIYPDRHPAALVPEIFAPGVISGPVHDAAPAFSPDGQTVYFFRRGPSLPGVILESHLSDGQWGKPVIASFSGQWQDIEPAMAPDGSYMIFASNRPVVAGGQVLNGSWSGQHFPRSGGNLWRVDRKGAGWSVPRRLPEIINSDSSVFSPAITADGSLYFMKPLGDTGKFHIYRSANVRGQFEAPVAVSFSAPDSIGDFDPAVAPDESFVIFCSRRPPAVQTELYIVFKKNGIWTGAVPMGVNRSVGNTEPRLSPDHRRVYFSNSYTPTPGYPTDAAGKQRALESSVWETGAQNIWSVALDKWL